jgi:hypothetical protein
MCMVRYILGTATNRTEAIFSLVFILYSFGISDVGNSVKSVAWTWPGPSLNLGITCQIVAGGTKIGPNGRRICQFFSVRQKQDIFKFPVLFCQLNLKMKGRQQWLILRGGGL